MDRYIRQKQFQRFSPEFQSVASNSRILIAGAGATGTRTFEILLRCGIGSIDICDDDTVELHNLQRQHIYTELDVGRNKSDILCEWGRVVNSAISINGHRIRLDENDVSTLLKQKRCSAVIDCTDNFASRVMLSRAGLAHNVPVFLQGAAGAEGFVFAQIAGGACLSCFMNEQIIKGSEHNAATDGIFSPICGIVSSFTASLLLAYLNGTPIPSEYIQCNSYPPFSIKHYPIDRDSECSVCGNKK